MKDFIFFVLFHFLWASVQKPNILLIQVDQLTSEVLSFYGQEKPAFTPHLNKLASRGTVFKNTFSNSPLCAPSRCSMLTGRLASRSGCWDNAADFSSTIPTIAHYLRDLGYETILSGKMHFVGPDQLHGYEERLTADVYPADPGWYNFWESENFRTSWHHDMHSIMDAGVRNRTLQIDFDEETFYQANRKLYDLARSQRNVESRPFFLTISFTQPHDPYLALPEYFDLYSDEDIPEVLVHGTKDEKFAQRIRYSIGYDEWDLNSELTTKARRAYYGMVSHVDYLIGELIKTLEKSGLTENTWILFTSDHGDHLGERDLWYKMTFYDWSVKVPLLIVNPNKKNGNVVQNDVSLVDLLPTIIDIAGGSEDDLFSFDGQSLLKPLDLKRPVYSEYFAEGSVGPRFMIKTPERKFIYSEEDGHELYDVVSDPINVKNLINQDEYKEEVLKFLKQVHKNWNIKSIRHNAIQSQKQRALIFRSIMKGKFPDWDFKPNLGATERDRYTRNTAVLLSQDRDARIPRFNPRVHARKGHFKIRPIGGEQENQDDLQKTEL